MSLSRHEFLPHTADAGLRAEAPDLPRLFEEAATALAELAADVDPSVASAETGITLEALDLIGLAFAWLNELVGLVDVHGALAGTRVASVEQAPGGGWRLRATASLAPFDQVLVRRRADVKSATYHGLLVEPVDGGWSLVAYVDI